jgi:hypothetical protein
MIEHFKNQSRQFLIILQALPSQYELVWGQIRIIRAIRGFLILILSFAQNAQARVADFERNLSSRRNVTPAKAGAGIRKNSSFLGNFRVKN